MKWLCRLRHLPPKFMTLELKWWKEWSRYHHTPLNFRPVQWQSHTHTSCVYTHIDIQSNVVIIAKNEKVSFLIYNLLTITTIFLLNKRKCNLLSHMGETKLCVTQPQDFSNHKRILKQLVLS